MGIILINVLHKMNCGLCGLEIEKEDRIKLIKTDDIEEFCHIICIENAQYNQDL